jgi:hypothetical protein
VYEATDQMSHVSPVSAAVIAFTVVTGLVLQFAWSGSAPGRLTILSVALGVLFGAVAWWVWAQAPDATARYEGDGFRQGTLFPAAFLAVYILTPFVQIVMATDRVRFPYPTLFHHSWNNVFIGGLAQLFTGLYWMLISLWGALFNLVGIHWFNEVFHTHPFVFLTIGPVFGLGVALARENESVISMLRRITLALFRILMPLLSLIALLFLGTLAATGLSPLWATKTASPLLLSLLILTIVFINAVFQDGGGERPYPDWLRRLVAGALLAMPIFAGVCLYSIDLRIEQYGLMPERVYVVMLALVAGLYSVGYATAVLWRTREWLGLVRSVNLWMSLVVAIVALLLHTPVLDPLAWSAANQYHRLAQQRVSAEQFDFSALRFKLGAVGYQTLQSLTELDEHPQVDLVRRNVASVEQAGRYSVAEVRRDILLREDLRVVRVPDGVPEGLAEIINEHVPSRVINRCVENRDCVVFPVSPAAGRLIFVLYPSGSNTMLYGFSGERGEWRQAGEFEFDYSDCGYSRGPDHGEVLAAIESDDVTSAPESRQTLRIGDWVFRRQPMC